MSKNETIPLTTYGIPGQVRQRTAVHTVESVCRTEAPQEITHVSEMKTSLTDGVGI